MTEEQAALATAAGRSWAELKAEALRGVVLAQDWPDMWNDADSGPLPFKIEEAEAKDWSGLRAIANHVAHERWRELVSEQRALESADETEADLEPPAIRLEETLSADLPPGLEVSRDGPRVYLRDTSTGMERTVTSLEHAWRVVSDWQEKRTPGM